MQDFEGFRDAVLAAGESLCGGLGLRACERPWTNSKDVGRTHCAKIIHQSVE